MTENAREARVLDAVVTLVDSLLHDFDVVELLTELTERCAQLLDVSSAGLLLADPLGQLRLMAATSDKTQEIELFELQADEGPCRDSYTSGAAVSVADLSASLDRWPRFVPAAREAGFVSVHAVPMTVAGGVLGALGLFGAEVGDLNEADLLVGRSLAHVASVAIVQEHPPTKDAVLPHLRSALTSRIVVEQAKGLLRQRLGVTVADAFRLLRMYARDSGTHLTQLARTLMSDAAARPAIVADIASLARAAQRPDQSI